MSVTQASLVAVAAATGLIAFAVLSNELAPQLRDGASYAPPRVAALRAPGMGIRPTAFKLSRDAAVTVQERSREASAATTLTGLLFQLIDNSDLGGTAIVTVVVDADTGADVVVQPSAAVATQIAQQNLVGTVVAFTGQYGTSR